MAALQWKDISKALFAEFIGTLLFTFLGNEGRNGPLGNGIALAVLVYLTANTSGGHLNPAVSIACIVTREIHVLVGLLYVVVQVVGSILGTLISSGLVVNSTLGSGTGPGCFPIPPGVTDGIIFGWEFMTTFALIAVIFAVAVDSRGFGNAGPAAIGLTLYASANSSGMFSGGYLNPARILGPAIVFGCNLRWSWIYVLAQVVGGCTAAIFYKTGFLGMPFYRKIGEEETNKTKIRRKTKMHLDNADSIQMDYLNSIGKGKSLESLDSTGFSSDDRT